MNLGGKIPPQSIDNEVALLGVIGVHGRKFYDLVDGIVTPEMFYKERHSLIFAEFAKLAARGESIDFITIIDQATKSGTLENIGGREAIIDLCDDKSNSANVEYYAGVIREMWLRRKQIVLAQQHGANAYDLSVDIFETIESTEKQMQEISGTSTGLESATDIYLENVKKMEMANKRMVEAQKSGMPVITGVPTGYMCLDRETGGWEPTDFIIIAARPGMGKTHFALGCAMEAAKAKMPCLFFSLEMDKGQLVQRMIAFHSEVNTRDMRQGNLGSDEWSRMNDASKLLEGIWIDDTGSVTVSYIRSRCRAAKKNLLAAWKKANPRKKESEFRMLVIVDYLQLMGGGEAKKGGTREQEVSAIARGLKALAKEIKSPVIALSQLSRGVETRGGDKKPIPSDLKESGDIEAAADMIVFLWRAEYYGFMQDETGQSTAGIGEAIVAKYRHGRTGTYQLGFTGKGGWTDPERRRDFTGNELNLPKIQPKPMNFGEPKHSEEQPGGGDQFPF